MKRYTLSTLTEKILQLAHLPDKLLKILLGMTDYLPRPDVRDIAFIIGDRSIRPRLAVRLTGAAHVNPPVPFGNAGLLEKGRRVIFTRADKFCHTAASSCLKRRAICKKIGLGTLFAMLLRVNEISKPNGEKTK